jgi:hypothetical protein
MTLGYRTGLVAVVAAAVVIEVSGCVTHPRPVAEAIVAGSSQPAASGGGNGGRAAPGAPSGSAASRSTDERRSGLDKQLDDSLQAFDVRLRQEQQKIADERDARQATVAATTASASDGATSSASASDAAPASAATASDGPGTASAGGPAGPHGGKLGKARTTRAGDLRSDRSDGVTGNIGGNGAPATVIPDGNDDDIVARRLRKAAEQETDPELKGKLWKEYVEYKKNTRVR